ncbi:AraC family transcriptional regulator [Elizabethkingia anophelis]|nr:AraC family transcriptional regulator [Elizabethkingia anophelis]MCT3994394.1 AraC family transcriptional regulator [Elizabethkingia anophelis]MCT3997884.1 AraC family transcriptional regulator [Elizabethkingia anophelis]MCT4254929.1 AraC family transcriptional regulator [Elizabethkingia anophelis]
MYLFKRWKIIIYFLLVAVNSSGQSTSEKKVKSLKDLRSSYENLEENNEKAVPLVQSYIKLAKSEKNYGHVFQGYKDLIYYTKDRNRKLIYADSCVSYALRSRKSDLISHAYLTRGIVHYFFFKNYQPALDEYLKAYDYSFSIKDDYLKNSIIYHLGVVKSYLGYYEEALSLFTQCTLYFKAGIERGAHPNVVYNNQKGYFNSLHQQAICYQNINNLQRSDSIVSKALLELPSENEFLLEKAYFLKSRGISEFRKGNYSKSIENLSAALPELIKIDDFTWISVSYFYIGKSFFRLKQTEKALSYFSKVDSIVQRQDFIVPEIRENYEILINYYHASRDAEKELFYTNQLLKADNILSRDFKYLSSKIHKEYETKALLKKQQDLEHKNTNTTKLLIGAILIITTLVIILLYRNRKEKQAQKQYELLEARLLAEKQSNKLERSHVIIDQEERKENRTGMPDALIEELLEKLEKFELRKEFKQKGLTQLLLAKRFNTNTTYLSQVINDYKENNFNTYLNILRINYITHELYHNQKFLKYTIEALANECGISSRKTFSDVFIEINGIRPTVFIKKRKEELDELKKSVNIIID